MATTTILLYARTGAGKTAQIGRLAEDLFIKTGLKTRIYNTDRGGPDTIRPYIDLGIIEFVDIGQGDIWIFIDKAIKGYTKKDGKWVFDAEANKKVGMFAYESAHSMASLLQKDMEAQAGQGRVIGGDANTSFDVQGDGETLRVGATKGFQKYAIPQSTIYNAMLASQLLPAEYVLWTAGVSKEEDDVNTTKIIGPDVIGKALTGVLPKDFNYTFRMDVIAAQANKAERHILYLGNTVDLNAGNASALGNIRRPLDAPQLVKTAIEPADIVEALKLCRSDASKVATDAIKKRVGARISATT